MATPTLDASLYRAWLGVIHQVVRETGAHLTTEPQQPRAGRNYYQAHVASAGGASMRYLLNDTARLVAAANGSDPHELVARFIDLPCGELFQAVGLQVATPDELEQPLTADGVSVLTDAERRDIAYHRPERVGDVLFNWFD